MNINFTEKELQVIEMFAPGKTAEEIINIVLRDWFDTNFLRMYKNVKNQDVMVDEVIAVHNLAKESGGGVVK